MVPNTGGKLGLIHDYDDETPNSFVIKDFVPGLPADDSALGKEDRITKVNGQEATFETMQTEIESGRPLVYRSEKHETLPGRVPGGLEKCTIRD